MPLPMPTTSASAEIKMAHVPVTEEPDIAVFRFTLGIPGFDDADIPRILGLLALAILAVNKLLSEAPSDSTQVRAEGLGAILAGLAIAIPSVHRRLQELQPGRGRRSSQAESQGAMQKFHLDSNLTEEQKQELAWASFALLKNANIDGLLVCSQSRALVGRGAFSPGSNMEIQNLQQAEAIQGAMKSTDGSVYYPDSPQLQGSSLKKLLPAGTQSLFVSLIGGQKDPQYLLMWSISPRALSKRDRQWAAAIAEKLHQCCG